MPPYILCANVRQQPSCIVLRQGKCGDLSCVLPRLTLLTAVLILHMLEQHPAATNVLSDMARQCFISEDQHSNMAWQRGTVMLPCMLCAEGFAPQIWLRCCVRWRVVCRGGMWSGHCCPGGVLRNCRAGRLSCTCVHKPVFSRHIAHHATQACWA